MTDIEREGFDYDCQGKHKQVGNRCMKCGAHIIDFSSEYEGDGYMTGWTRMKGTIDYTHASKEVKDELNG